jgi:hypothetical protein
MSDYPPRQSLEAMWLEYIMKLNDRMIARRQVSGLTFWAHLCIIAVLFYRLIDSLPNLMTSENDLFIMDSYFVCLINLLTTVFAGFIIVVTYLFPFSERRLATDLSQRYGQYTSIILTPFILLIAANNFYVGFFTAKYWTFYVFGVYWMLVLFAIQNYYILKKGPQLEPGSTIVSSHASRKFFASQFFIIIVLFGCAIYQIGDIKLLLIDSIALVKTSIELAALFILFPWFLIVVEASKIRSWLLNLEQRILVDRLTADEIRHIFITEFAGQITLE